MADAASVVIVGGTRAIGQEIARHYADRGESVVLTGQDPGERRGRACECRGEDDRRDLRPLRADIHRRRARGRRPGPPPRARRDRPRSEHGRRLRHRQGHPAGDPQAGRLHRGRPHPPTAPDRRRVDRAVRRDGEGTTVPGLDDGHDGQRRRRRADADAGRGTQAVAGQLHPPGRRREQPVLVTRSRPPSRSTRARPRSDVWPRWPRSSTRRSSCSRTPR